MCQIGTVSHDTAWPEPRADAAAWAGGPPAPLASTLGRVRALEIPYLSLDMRVSDPPPGAGWLTRDDLLQMPVMERILARIGAGAGTTQAAIRGTWFLEAYAGALAGAAILCVLVDGRAPDVSPGNAVVHLAPTGRPDAIAFRAPVCAGMHGDGARGAGVVKADGPAALWTWFRERLVRHLEPLVEALVPVTGRGRRALWASVEDACAAYLNWLGGALGRREDARAHLDHLLGVAPLRRRARFEDVPLADGTASVHVRNGCCLGYRREAEPVMCTSCPLMGAAERMRRLAEAGG